MPKIHINRVNSSKISFICLFSFSPIYYSPKIPKNLLGVKINVISETIIPKRCMKVTWTVSDLFEIFSEKTLTLSSHHNSPFKEAEVRNFLYVKKSLYTKFLSHLDFFAFTFWFFHYMKSKPLTDLMLNKKFAFFTLLQKIVLSAFSISI